MNIAFLTTEYPPLNSGGIGTSIRNLARSLTHMGNKVQVVGLGHHTEFNDEGVKVKFIKGTTFPKMGWWVNRYLLRKELNKLIFDEKIEIVEAPDWCGLSAGIKINCPLVIRCNGSATYFGHILNEHVRCRVRLTEKVALSQATSIAAVSQFTADITKQVFNLNKSINIISNGIDINQFKSNIEKDNEENFILYFGSLVRKKGLLDLSEIFSKVIDLNPNIILKILGRDCEDKKTRSRSTWELFHNGLSPQARRNVQYLGSKRYDEVQEYVQRAAICVFPSYAEAMPLAWLEAMACEKPIVAYDIGWASEAIENQKSGILVPKGDMDSFAKNIIKLILNKRKRQAIGYQARQRVINHFSTDVITEKTLEWYRSQI